jgi:hypothetical protein
VVFNSAVVVTSTIVFFPVFGATSSACIVDTDDTWIAADAGGNCNFVHGIAAAGVKVTLLADATSLKNSPLSSDVWFRAPAWCLSVAVENACFRSFIALTLGFDMLY